MTLPSQVEEFGLPRVGARPAFHTYLAEVWRRREFIVTMARFRMRAALEGNRLGMAWVVLRPILNAGIYGLIFGVLQGGNRPPDYPAYVVVGVFLFEFFQGCFNDGSKAISGNRSLVQSLAFPRMTLPLAATVERFLQFLIMLAVLIPILMIFGHFPRWDWLLMIPLVVLFTLFNAGVAMITARLTVHVSDLTQLLPFISRILFYTSGVLFAVDKILANHPVVLRIFDFYPLYQVLEIARHHLIGGSNYPSYYWAVLTVGALVVFLGGAVFFWRAEERYGRE
ncbi:phosphate ABC transporter permease [Tessaracoccus aquimaris]|uniref:Transport permease protein n=1 Tax=Tessaracoccus aquimaris TaxID=1332264 RepID=A0A1Q2CRQ1_9ACTN|nr:ABC transporter permease [Tessaracoccus aquimaris]AQP48782.1 phosphate ABC transporter permease [Tessaracoccus aquimaris]